MQETVRELSCCTSSFTIGLIQSRRGRSREEEDDPLLTIRFGFQQQSNLAAALGLLFEVAAFQTITQT
jgi:hypothetical protein